MTNVSKKVESGLDNQHTAVFKELRERDVRKANVVFHNIPEPQARSKEERIAEDNDQVEEVCSKIGEIIRMQTAAKFTVRKVNTPRMRVDQY